MPKLEATKIDSKGRLLLPHYFREALRLREGDKVFLSIDEESQRIVLNPAVEKNLFLIEMILGDEPGALARLAGVLAKEGVDLISTESRSLERSKNAVWKVLCNAGSADASELKKKLLKAGALSVRIRRT